MIFVRVGRCVRVFVWNPTFRLFVFFAMLAAAYSYGHCYYACVDHCYPCLVMVNACMRCVCAPCTDSHGTTAIAQQV